MIEASEPAGHYTLTHVKGNLTGKGERLAYHIVPHEIEPGWEVGKAVWKEDAATLYATKIEHGTYLARAYVEANGGEVDVNILLAHLNAHGITTSTAQRSLERGDLKRKGGKIRIS
jgi:hypothetical protein